MRKTLLSILIPLYNEEEFISELLDRVLRATLPAGVAREIIVVDDSSTDGSRDIALEYQERYPAEIRVVCHDRNQGKGAAIRTAIDHAHGEFAVIQDADLEYDPREYTRLLNPLLEDRADAVYGSRFLIAGERRVLYFWHAMANRGLTTLCNLVADLNLTDMETCYKAFRTSLLKSIPIRSNRFGIEPEITIKLAQRQARIYETPISYYGRTYAEGKKIGPWDAVETLAVILRYWIRNDCYKNSGPSVLSAFSDAPRFNQWMADTIRPYLGKTILEVGAGIGNLTRHLARQRRHCVVTDIDSEHLARLRSTFQHRPNIKVRYCDASDPDHFSDLAGEMESVVCLNVLEHVEDDLGALRNFYTALKPGGRAIVLVPQGMEIFGSLDVALGHQRRYSQAQLRATMEEAGFRVERLVEFNRISRPGWYLTGRVFRQPSISRMTLEIFDRLVFLWRRIDHHIPWEPTSLIAIGVKEGRDPAVLAPARSIPMEVLHSGAPPTQ